MEPPKLHLECIFRKKIFKSKIDVGKGLENTKMYLKV